MKKRTQRKPLIFEYEGSTFRTHALGFLEANETLLKYLPTIIELTESFEKKAAPEGEEPEVDMMAMLKKLPKGLVTDICTDLLPSTEFKGEDGKFLLLDPNDFDTIGECLAVIWEVFQFNYPDFFEKGQDTALTEQATPTPEPLPVPQGLMNKVMALAPSQFREESN